jgi:hypothetical protein
LYQSKVVQPSVHTVVQVPFENFAVPAAPHSSGGTPGCGVILLVAKISVSFDNRMNSFEYVKQQKPFFAQFSLMYQ